MKTPNLRIQCNDAPRLRALLPAGLLVAAALALAWPAAAADEPGWKTGCAYKLPSGAYQSNAAMITMYCPMLAMCQKMANEHMPNMEMMACFDFDPAAPADEGRTTANREQGASPASRQRNRL